MSALALALLLAPTGGFESTGHNAVTVEGLAGVAESRAWYPDLADEPRPRVQLGVLGMLPFMRLGYHRFLGHGISLGTGVQFVRLAASLHYDGPTTVWGASPRVGWSTSIARSASFWLRAGPGLAYLTTDATRAGQLSLGAEAILVFIPARDFGLMMLTYVERGVAGREIVDATNTGRAIRFQTMGVTLGVTLAF